MFGGNGFIGSKIIQYLRENKYQVYAPSRDDEIDSNKNLGHVIYAIGLTGDFRTRPHDTIEAHVGLLSTLLQQSVFDSWLYLSSTRIYSSLQAEELASEESKIQITPSVENLYDLSKMLGESLCLAQMNNKIRIARLSNVYGAGQSKHTFLGEIMNDLLELKTVTINESANSCKDYVSINDVVSLLVSISIKGKSNVYNVASGKSTSHAHLIQKLSELSDGELSFTKQAPSRAFPNIDISKVISEFNFLPSFVLDDLETMYIDLKNSHKRGLL